jgi:hypothetical protein
MDELDLYELEGKLFFLICFKKHFLIFLFSFIIRHWLFGIEIDKLDFVK